MKVFENDQREKEARLNSFEESKEKLWKLFPHKFDQGIKRLQNKLDTFNLELEKIKAQEISEIEGEVSKKYEESIQVKSFHFLILKVFRPWRRKISHCLKDFRKNLTKSYVCILLFLKLIFSEVEKQILSRKSRDEKAYRKKLEKGML